MNYWTGLNFQWFRRFWLQLFPPPALQPGHLQWSDHLIRRERYSVLWSFYDQTVYQGRYGEMIKKEQHLYKYIKPVFNACHRIVEFHATHLHGGRLDQDAGDGSKVPTCLPVVLGKGASLAVRPAIRSVWAASAWRRNKSRYGRFGACLGDVGLEVIPDEKRGLCRIRVVHPAEIVRCTRDPYGNLKSYLLERWEVDPEDRQGTRMAAYREECVNDGGTVLYRTFKDGGLYHWPGTPGAEWESRWGFVPMVLTRHIDQGTDWGVAEIQYALAKTLERDDQGSLLGDQIRATVKGPWLLKGAQLPQPPPMGPEHPFEGSDPFWRQEGRAPGRWDTTAPALRIKTEVRDDITFLTVPGTDISAQALVKPLPIAETVEFLRALADSLEQDFPEIQADKVVANGELASGSALEKARQKATDKILERRTGYDDGLAAALKMAMTMGGDLGFPDFTGLGGDAFADGLLDFEFGDRPVFAPSRVETAGVAVQQATAVRTFQASGIHVRDALVLSGVPEETADRIAARAALTGVTAAPNPSPPPEPQKPPQDDALLTPPTEVARLDPNQPDLGWGVDMVP